MRLWPFAFLLTNFDELLIVPCIFCFLLLITRKEKTSREANKRMTTAPTRTTGISSRRTFRKVCALPWRTTLKTRPLVAWGARSLKFRGVRVCMYVCVCVRAFVCVSCPVQSTWSRHEQLAVACAASLLLLRPTHASVSTAATSTTTTAGAAAAMIHTALHYCTAVRLLGIVSRWCVVRGVVRKTSAITPSEYPPSAACLFIVVWESIP